MGIGELDKQLNKNVRCGLDFTIMASTRVLCRGNQIISGDK
jgi:hypothetical protein